MGIHRFAVKPRFRSSSLQSRNHFKDQSAQKMSDFRLNPGVTVDPTHSINIGQPLHHSKKTKKGGSQPVCLIGSEAITQPVCLIGSEAITQTDLNLMRDLGLPTKFSTSK